MQIWLNTIDSDVILDASKRGIMSGVTTNPTILSKAKDVKATILRLLEIQDGPVAVQVTRETAEEMRDEGMRIFEFSDRLIVKVPVDKEGLMAMHELQGEGVPVLATGVLHPLQATLAANQEVKYVTPYFSHMEDAYENLKIMMQIVRPTSSKLLVASVRQFDHLVYAASLGVDAVTIKEDLYHELMADHPLLERLSQKFIADWTLTHKTRSMKEILKI